jgi:hypothetical protein
MRLSDIAAEAVHLDVDLIPVVMLPSGNFLAFDVTGASRPFPNRRRAQPEGDALTAEDFRAWVVNGTHRFDQP